MAREVNLKEGEQQKRSESWGSKSHSILLELERKKLKIILKQMWAKKKKKTNLIKEKIWVKFLIG